MIKYAYYRLRNNENNSLTILYKLRDRRYILNT